MRCDSVPVIQAKRVSRLIIGVILGVSSGIIALAGAPASSACSAGTFVSLAFSPTTGMGGSPHTVHEPCDLRCQWSGAPN